MPFYDLDKTARATLVATIHSRLEAAFSNKLSNDIQLYYADSDTYIRKAAYIATGRICKDNEAIKKQLIAMLWQLTDHDIAPVRQTTINAAGEIGRADFESVQPFFDKGLFDAHHTVRNAVIGSVKKMGEVNPGPVLIWARVYLHHPDKEIRREICHGIELRGRKYPEDILPLLRALEWDKTARVRNTLVHVLGQIAYKKGCLERVAEDLKYWENRELVHKALAEIVSVHYRYRNFTVHSQDEARRYLKAQFPEAAQLLEE